MEKIEVQTSRLLGLRLAAKLLLDKLDFYCGSNPAWKAEMSLLDAAIRGTADIAAKAGG